MRTNVTNNSSNRLSQAAVMHELQSMGMASAKTESFKRNYKNKPPQGGAKTQVQSSQALNSQVFYQHSDLEGASDNICMIEEKIKSSIVPNKT